MRERLGTKPWSKPGTSAQGTGRRGELVLTTCATELGMAFFFFSVNKGWERKPLWQGSCAMLEKDAKHG